jgi:hypothetical protein
VSDDAGYIREMLGRIDGKLDSLDAKVTVHATHDETVQTALFQRIEALQLAHASQKGSIKVLASIGTALGGVAGAALTYLLKHRGV